MRALKRLGIDSRERRLIESLYTNQKAVVRTDGEYSDSCLISGGNRQGCPLSVLLFNNNNNNKTLIIIIHIFLSRHKVVTSEAEVVTSG